MGSGRLDHFPEQGKEGEKSPSLSYSEIIERLCPDYLAMGMTWDEYWNGDPEMATAFRKAFRMIQKQRNQDLWLQGLYIYEALLDVSPVFHDFVKSPKPIPYPAEPYALSEEERVERERAKAEAEDKKTQASFRAWVQRVNQSRGKNVQKGPQGNGR